MGIMWQDHILILESAGVHSKYSLLSQRRLRWLGHVRCVEDGRMPKDVLYGELASGSRRVGRPALRYKDTCKRDKKTCNIVTDTWEAVASDRSRWRRVVRKRMDYADRERGLKAEEKRTRGKLSNTSTSNTPTGLTCPTCSRDCRSRIGLFRHARRCSGATD